MNCIKICDKEWIKINYLSGGQYSATKNIRFKTSTSRLDLFDYSDAYIVVKGRISVRGTNDANKRNKKLTFKNNASVRSCISKINNTFIDNAGDLDVIMSIYNLLEYSEKYSMTSGSLWNYYRDKINDDANENYNNETIINSKTITSTSFEYKIKIIGSTPKDNNILDAEVVAPLKF